MAVLYVSSGEQVAQTQMAAVPRLHFANDNSVPDRQVSENSDHILNCDPH